MSIHLAAFGTQTCTTQHFDKAPLEGKGVVSIVLDGDLLIPAHSALSSTPHGNKHEVCEAEDRTEGRRFVKSPTQNA